RAVFTVALEGAGLVRLDPSGDSLFCVDPVAGRVTTLNAWGKRIGAFEVPAPMAGCVMHPRDRGLIVATRRGIVARFTPWGEQVWALDLAQYTGSLSVDPRGTLLLVASFSRGAEGITPDKGAPYG